VLRPQGLSVILLGPDGAGKSAVIDRMELGAVFNGTVMGGFAPPLRRLFTGRQERNDQPHALPPRPFMTSVARAGYWFAYHTLGQVALHGELARSKLILHHRHFVDVMVDGRRYRYGGPTWLLRLIWSLIPKPDLVIVLDAAPDVLQSRKQEVSFEECARQRQAYLTLARQLPNAHVVDASQPLEQVVADVSWIILDAAAQRINRAAPRRRRS
jgi:hypothetical protein